VLLVLEAMKMQNEIRASRAGRVVKVAVVPKQAVDGGVLMVVLDEPEAVPV
jgi:biotin carboxyl carrier protein